MLGEGLQVRVKALGITRLGVYDLFVDIHGVVSLEGRIAGQHLVQKDTQRPPVDRLSVALV